MKDCKGGNMLEDIFKFMKIMAACVTIVTVILISFAIIKNLLIILANADDKCATIISVVILFAVIVAILLKWADDNAIF
jgi:membrane protein DedA with SNARE-associated domain